MWLQAVARGLVALADPLAAWGGAARQRGARPAAVEPTLLAAIGDVAHPAWRARSVGIYRLWRDGGFAVGALLAGIVADVLGVRAAVWTVAGLTAVSGLVVAVRMYETHHRTRVTAGVSTDPEEDGDG
jgi:MFS family permease